MLSNYPEACTCFSPPCLDDLTGRDGITVRTRTVAGRHAFREDDPLLLGRHAAIPLREIVVRTSRSSGPGSQHANVTASRVEASFDVRGSRSLSEQQEQRILPRAGPRLAP